MSKITEFLDFWVENGVHAREQYGTPGASQSVCELTRRCIEAAKAQGVSEAEMQSEIGDVTEYIRRKLGTVNKAERGRQGPSC